MRGPRSSAFAGVLVAGVALLGSDLARADLLEFTGTLSITHIPFLTQGFPLGTLGSFDHAGSGLGVSETAPNQVSGGVDVSGFTGTGTSFVNGTFQPPTLWRFRVTGIGDPDFSGTPLHGPLAVRGFLTVTLAASTISTLPLTENGTVGLGLGGTLPHAQFGEWTTGLVRLTGVATSYPGTRSTTLSQSGFDERTANGAGDLQVVTPIRFTSAGVGQPDRGGFAVLQLHFVPEPDQLVLLGAGAMALLGLNRCRMSGRTRAGPARRS
jgi:hypothetical protein